MICTVVAMSVSLREEKDIGRDYRVSVYPFTSAATACVSRLPYMPGSAISCHESLRGLGSPRASRVERQLSSPLRFPVLIHGIDKRPGLIDPIRARKERWNALHGIV